MLQVRIHRYMQTTIEMESIDYMLAIYDENCDSYPPIGLNLMRRFHITVCGF